MKNKILVFILLLSLFSIAWLTYAGWIVMQPTIQQSEIIRVYCPASVSVRPVSPPAGLAGQAIEIECFHITTQGN